MVASYEHFHCIDLLSVKLEILTMHMSVPSTVVELQSKVKKMGV